MENNIRKDLAWQQRQRFVCLSICWRSRQTVICPSAGIPQIPAPSQAWNISWPAPIPCLRWRKEKRRDGIQHGAGGHWFLLGMSGRGLGGVGIHQFLVFVHRASPATYGGGNSPFPGWQLEKPAGDVSGVTPRSCGAPEAADPSREGRTDGGRAGVPGEALEGIRVIYNHGSAAGKAGIGRDGDSSEVKAAGKTPAGKDWSAGGMSLSPPALLLVLLRFALHTWRPCAGALGEGRAVGWNSSAPLAKEGKGLRSPFMGLLTPAPHLSPINPLKFKETPPQKIPSDPWKQFPKNLFRSMETPPQKCPRIHGNSSPKILSDPWKHLPTSTRSTGNGLVSPRARATPGLSPPEFPEALPSSSGAELLGPVPFVAPWGFGMGDRNVLGLSCGFVWGL